jgi:hypothetical protein
MTDFLENVAARSFESVSAIRPRLVSLFEPMSLADAHAGTGIDVIAVTPDTPTPSHEPAESPSQTRSNVPSSTDSPAHVSSPTRLALPSAQGPESEIRDRKVFIDEVGTMHDRQPITRAIDRLDHEPAIDAHVNTRDVDRGRNTPSHKTPTTVARVESQPARPEKIPSVDAASLVPPAPVIKLAAELRGTVQIAGVQSRFRAQPAKPYPTTRQSDPDVHVTIGRIEVRAIPESNPKRAVGSPSPVMGLDEYLRSRAQRDGR